MPTPNSPEQKLIEALEYYADTFCNVDTAYKEVPNKAMEAIPIARSLLAELVELREKAEALDYLIGKRPWRLWAMVTDANGEIPDDCPVALKNILNRLIKRKERT